MAKLVLIADDLTGALDSSVHFAQNGIRTEVLIDGTASLNDCAAEEAEVIAVNTASRHDTPQTAAEKVRRIVREAKDLHIPYLYKKTDSAMRGNVGAELQSVCEELRLCRFPFIPAYPRLGRTVKKGQLYINGTPLQETSVAKDAFTPVNTADIKSILQKQTALSVVNEYDCKAPEAKGICVYDAGTEEEMIQIGKCLKRKEALYASAGSGGFAEILAELVFEEQVRAHTADVKPELCKNIPNGGIDRAPVFLCGSITENAVAQIRRAREEGIRTVKIPDEILYDGKAGHYTEEMRKSETELERFVRQTAASGKENSALLLYTADLENFFADEMPVHVANAENKALVEKNSGRLVRYLLDREEIDTLCVFGGDTLLGVMQAAQVKTLCPHRELFPGIVQGTFQYKGKLISIVTKAGSFGDDRIVGKILNRLYGENR